MISRECGCTTHSRATKLDVVRASAARPGTRAPYEYGSYSRYAEMATARFDDSILWLWVPAFAGTTMR